MTSTRRIVALLSALLLPLFAVSVVTTTASAADGSLFQPLSGFKPSASANVSVRPTAYKAYRADLAGIRAQLAGSGNKTLSIPDPAGTMTDFTVAESSVMAPSLQADHPDIRTYAGSAANGTTIRLDVTPLGFHAMVRRPDGIVWYVEPATRAVGESRVLSFAGAAAGDAPGLEDEVKGVAQQAAQAIGGDFSTPGGPVTQRVYRLALVTDPAYALAITGGVTDHATDDPIVFAAKATLVNRVNEVYNDDVAYRFEMIPGTDTKLNLLTAAEMSGPGGPCGANACFPAATGSYDCGDVLNRNTFALGQLVGADTFDIGHIGMGVNGGGIAGLGVVGGASKARGCTGIPTPVGDVYAIDYVAHEMGHQMGGNHTFNGTQVNCSGGNRNGATSVEPGSGVTIMAYAGICGSDDLQPHSDPYFSHRSIDEFEATTAATPANVAEQQVVNLSGYDGTDAFTISCTSGCSTSTAITNGANYTAADLLAAVNTVTGKTPTSVTGYDGGAFNTNGFTVTWPSSAGDVPKLVISPTVGTFTTFTGVINNGGPGTNGGTPAAVPDEVSPVVTVPADKTIPKQTPFTLTGAATDANAGDVLTYQWEQTDNGVGAGTSLVSNNKVNGPLFRVFGKYANVTSGGTVTYHSPGENMAGTDPSRTFPDLDQILAGNTNAATGTCPAPVAGGTIPVTDPALNCFSEFLPTSAWVGTGNRVMHFRLTARDEFTPD
ncbi:MAG TPA: M12 family metallo-peptidase, partial [Nocardioides sp.]|uniref:M12 family metallo-peptidase n=1 Tax=Nocardioides sp. TaxID=35761 RepID=UPI002E35F671